MSRGLYKTVTRKDRDGRWIALRMCEDQEIMRAYGDTPREAQDALKRQFIAGITHVAWQESTKVIADK